MPTLTIAETARNIYPLIFRFSDLMITGKIIIQRRSHFSEELCYTLLQKIMIIFVE